MKQKFKAFTILELMIGIVVFGLVVLAALSVIGFVDQQYDDFEKDTSTYFDLTAFQTNLQKDFLLSHQVSLIDEKINFDFIDYQVVYLFENNKVSRQIIGEAIDFEILFNAPVSIVEASFSGQKKSMGILDKLVLQRAIQDKEELYCFHKTYSAKEYMTAHANQN